MTRWREGESWTALQRRLSKQYTPRLAPTNGVEAKAVIGPYVANVEQNPSMRLFNGDDRNSLMAEAQALYHQNVWVAAAERAVFGRILRTAWHLEDENGDTVDRKTHRQASELLDQLDAPNPSMSRRSLWGLSLRHLGLAGNAAWLLDEREALNGTPNAVYYLNPARLTPVIAGGLLVGWVLDAVGNRNSQRLKDSKPVPLQASEVQLFTLDQDDWTVWGTGIAEAAAMKISLFRLANQHATSMMALGGRKSGMVMPRDEGQTFSIEEFEQLVRDWRSIANDPDSAKRLQVLRQPVEFTPSTMTAADMQLTDIMNASRDDILAAWGIPPTQIGVPLAAGLNSGESRNYDEAVLWQGTVAHRLDAFREGIQEYLDLWEPVIGFRPAIVFDVPSFDDNAPLFKQAVDAKFVPLTHAERRAIIGLDPFDDEALNGQVYLDQTMIPLGGLVPVAPQESAQIETGLTESASKASLTETLRTKTERQFTPSFRNTAAKVLAEMRDVIASAIESKWASIQRKPKDDSPWWNQRRWVAALEAAFAPLYGQLGRQVSLAASKRVETGKASVDADVVATVVRSGGTRITAIADTTRDAIRNLIVQGVQDGLGPSEVAQNIRDATAFNDARSELIARTETMLAYNEAALGTYRNLDVEYVEALDGDQDDICVARVARNPWPIGDAQGEQDHPNGTLDWAPILRSEGKAAIERTEALVAESESRVLAEVSGLRERLREKDRPTHIEVHPAPAPVVTIAEGAVQYHGGPITVEAPEPAQFTVNLPEQEAPVVNMTLPEAKATGPQQVEITAMPTRVKRAQRNQKREIEGTIETDG